MEYQQAVQTIMNKPTHIEHHKMRHLILDAPNNSNLASYVKEMVEYGVTDLIRTCERTYDDIYITEAGITVHELIFPDGEPPSQRIISEWLDIVTKASAANGAVAVHCVAGLGRAPVLVAVALIEDGMDPLDAVVYIRDRRKGAINRRQLQFLKDYRRITRQRRWYHCRCFL